MSGATVDREASSTAARRPARGNGALSLGRALKLQHSADHGEIPKCWKRFRPKLAHYPPKPGPGLSPRYSRPPAAGSLWKVPPDSPPPAEASDDADPQLPAWGADLLGGVITVDFRIGSMAHRAQELRAQPLRAYPGGGKFPQISRLSTTRGRARIWTMRPGRIQIPLLNLSRAHFGECTTSVGREATGVPPL